MSLNPNAQKWVEALRSGKYKQTTGTLNRLKVTDIRPVGLCCLGVACEVAIENGVPVRKETHPYNGDIAVYSDCTANWPDMVQEWIGLKPTQWIVLATLNDAGKTFNEIADYIEAHPALFEESEEDSTNG